MKLILMTSFVMIFSACASTEFDKRLDQNFIYQCSIKLIGDADKRISGDDAAKICTAAYQVEKTVPAAEASTTPVATPVATPAATPTSTPVAATTPAPKKSLVDLDEVKPEPNPAE